jgi:NAD(P)H-hydrate epimerase
MNVPIKNFINEENAKFYNIPIEDAENKAGIGEVKALYQPSPTSQKEENGQLTIIGGSSLFHGAPLLCLTIASRIVDMVFFSSPKDQKEFVQQLNSKLYSFIWVSEEEVEYYIEKSEAVLIGPGMMRYKKEISKQKTIDAEGKRTKETTERLLVKFPQKRWIIDAGSLQTMDAKYIPKGAIITPNSREFEMLFGIKKSDDNLKKMAEKYECIIVNKSAESGVYNGYKGYNNYKNYKYIGLPQAGLTKGGTGDVTAGIIAAFACKNDPFLAACAGTFLVKQTAKRLFDKMGNYYNADDLARAVPETIKWCMEY